MNEPSSYVENKKWEACLIQPIAKVMVEKGIARLVIAVENGIAKYTLDPTEKKEP